MVSSGWVKWEKDIEEDPRFKRMVNRLRNTSVTQALQERTVVSLVMGCLLKLWSYADSFVRTDDTLDLGPSDVDALVGLPGFAEAMPTDWFVIVDDQHVELPNYQTHSGIVAKRKALTQKRVENHRQRLRNDDETQESNDSVTGELPDQTRPDQTETGDAPPSLELTGQPSPPSPRSAGRRGGTAQRREGTNGKTPKTAWPQGFALDGELRAYVESQIADADADSLFAQFHDQALAKSWTYANWRLAWQVYVRNARLGSGHWAAGQYPRKSTAGGVQWQ